MNSNPELSVAERLKKLCESSDYRRLREVDVKPYFEMAQEDQTLSDPCDVLISIEKPPKWYIRSTFSFPDLSTSDAFNAVEVPLWFALFLYGEFTALKYCLRHSSNSTSLDFNVTYHKGNTILHLLFLVTDPDISVEVLKSIVERTSRCPGDRMDWQKENDDKKTLFSLAAENSLLSLWWNVLAENCVRFELPIPLLVEVQSVDYKNLVDAGEDENFIFHCGIREANEIFKCGIAALDLQLITEAVQNGANVNRMDDLQNTPHFYSVLKEANPQFFFACLEALMPIDFTLIDPVSKKTALHLLCTRTDAESVLEKIVQRLETHPRDKVDWELLDGEGHSFLSCASANECLHSIFQVVSPLGYFRQAIQSSQRFIITTPSSFLDRHLLVDSQQYHLFTFQYDMDIALESEMKRPTGKLSRILQCVTKGANLNRLISNNDGISGPVYFHLLLLNLDWFCQCIRVASLHLDFTLLIQRSNGACTTTVLHHACSMNANETKIVFQTVVDRLLQQREGDLVDWSLKDGSQETIFTCATRHQKLLDCWRIVEKLPYFQSGVLQQRLEVKVPISARTWSALMYREEDSIFVFREGVKEANSGIVEELRKESVEWKTVYLEVQRGANLNASFSGDEPIYLFLFQKGFEYWELVLSSPMPIDFTLCNSSILFSLLNLSPNQSLQAIEALVERLSHHHDEDTINWEAVDSNGSFFLAHIMMSETFASYAAALLRLPFFKDRGETVLITDFVRAEEWRKLDDMGLQRYFQLQYPRQVVHPATFALEELSHDMQSETDALIKVRQYVEDGADVCFRRRSDKCPIFLSFVNNEAALYSCLLTKLSIDFDMKSDENSSPLLIQLFGGCSSLDEQSKIRTLEAIAKRIQEHPEDTITWKYQEICQWACTQRRFLEVWNIIKDMPAVGDSSDSSIRLNGSIPLAEWEVLGGDQKYFVVNVD